MLPKVVIGLTVNMFMKQTSQSDQTCPLNWGGVLINLSYTGSEANGAYWAQFYKTNDNQGGLITESWDDDDTKNGQYYTTEELKYQTNGNTISFSDKPRCRYVDDFSFYKFTLFLYNSNNKLILKLWYGYSNSGKKDGDVTTNISGLTVGYY